MKVVLNILIAASLFVISYVLVEGVELTYSVFGFRILSGWLALLAGLAVLFGALSARFARAGRGGTTGAAAGSRPRPTAMSVIFFAIAGVIFFFGDQPGPALEVGDCYDIPTEREVLSVPTIACGEPHDSEVYLVTTVDASAGPGIRETTDSRAWRRAVSVSLRGLRRSDTQRLHAGFDLLLPAALGMGTG